MSSILETDRLILRELEAGDAPFILELVNDPDWLRYIGDRGVGTIEDAVSYIEEGPIRSYDEHGYGLWVANLSQDRLPVGLCGFLKRDSLVHPDLGYALLPAFRKQGYALEACNAALRYAADILALSRLFAIVSPDNHGSVRLLEKLGFSFEKPIEFGSDGEVARLYHKELT